MAKPRMISLNVGNTVLSSTTRQQIGGATVSSPTWAKEILALMPVVTPDTSVAAEPTFGLHEVESNDVSITPFQVLPAPGNAALGTSISPFIGKPEKYLMGVPLQGGEEISVYGNGAYNHTDEPYASATLIYVDEMWLARNGRIRQRHAKLGTVTSTGTTASTPVAGTKYQISNAEHIIETIGAVVAGTVAAADGIVGYLDFQSNEFEGVAKHQMPFNPIAGGLGPSLNCPVDGVSRMPCDIPMQSRSQVNIQDYGYFQLVPASAGRFVTGVIYE